MSAPVFLSKPGVICSAGSGIDDVWQACLAGNNGGLAPFTLCTGESFFAGRIADSALKPTADRFDMRSLSIEEAALEPIAADVRAAIGAYGAENVGVCVGSCDNGSEQAIAAHKTQAETGSFPPEYDLCAQSASYPAEFVRRKFGTGSVCLGFATACASSASALIKGAQLLRGGLCRAVIAGGMDMVGNTVQMGFHALEAVSLQKVNPFSKNRSGINLSDGAAFFVMTAEPIFDCPPVELLGYGESCDGEHMTAPKADGSGGASAMQEALRRANIGIADIDYINVHGTGTRLNDSMESFGIHSVFGKRAADIPVSSSKSVTGHALGAAGAIEAALCWQAVALQSRKLPVHVWDGEPDPALPRLNFVTKDFTAETPARICMSNSFAFGGCNVSLIIGRAR